MNKYQYQVINGLTMSVPQLEVLLNEQSERGWYVIGGGDKRLILERENPDYPSEDLWK